MKRDARIFTRGINDTVEPTEYVWGIIRKANRNILDGKENHFEGLKLKAPRRQLLEVVKNICK